VRVPKPEDLEQAARRARIEALRRELYALGGDDLLRTEILQKSRELDVLINAYYAWARPPSPDSR
jgi:hypothetical protein